MSLILGRYVDPAGTAHFIEVAVDADGKLLTSSSGAGASVDREFVVTTYRAAAAFAGAAIGDTITATQVIDVSSATPTTVTVLWRNQSTSTDLAAAPAAVNLELAGAMALTNGQLRASAVPMSLADGLNVAQGSRADAAYADATGAAAGTLVSLLKGLYVRLMSALNIRALSSASDSVTSVGASDLLLTGPVAQNALNVDLLTGTANGWYDASAFQSGNIQIVGDAGITAGAIIFEQTNDTAVTAVPLRAYESSGLSANPAISAITIAASASRLFKVQIDAKYVRVRISTAFTGGNVRAVATFSQRSASYPVVNVQQASSSSLQAAAIAQNSIFWNDSTTAQAAAAVVTGTARDVGSAAGVNHRYTNFRAFCFADQAGTLAIEVSNDNVTWRTGRTIAVAASTPADLAIPVMTRYNRAKFSNGATANTIFMLNTAYTGA